MVRVGRYTQAVHGTMRGRGMGHVGSGIATGGVLIGDALRIAGAHKVRTGLGIGTGVAIGGGAEIVKHRHNSTGRHQ